MKLLRLAYRNVLRNTRRSVITFTAIAVGILALVFVEAMLSGLGSQSEINLIDNQTSHLKLFAPGYEENKEEIPLEFALDQPERVVAEVSRAFGVVGSTKRLMFPAMLNNGLNDLACVGIGIDLDTDGQVFRLKQAVEQGAYLAAGDEAMLLGSGLAKIFQVRVGDYLTLIVRTYYDAIEARDLMIKGIVDTGNPTIDRGTVYLPLKLAQASLEMENKATEVAVRLASRKQLPRAIEEIEQGLGRAQIRAELSPWEKLAEDFLALHRMKKGASGLIVAIIVIIAGVGMVNTMLMASFERTREVGMLMALGMKPREAGWLFLLEGALIGLCGSALGCLIGGGLGYYTEVHGLMDLTKMYGDMDIGYPVKGMLYCDVSVAAVLSAFVFGVVVAVLASAYPAWRAARLQPTEALRHV